MNTVAQLDALLKAGHKNTAKLVKKNITNKLGHRTTVWVRVGEEPAEPKKGLFALTWEMFGSMNNFHEVSGRVIEKHKGDASKEEILDHIKEYMTNREKWKKRFSGEKKVTQRQPAAEKRVAGEKKSGGVGGQGPSGAKQRWNESIMRTIHDEFEAYAEQRKRSAGAGKTEKTAAEKADEENKKAKSERPDPSKIHIGEDAQARMEEKVAATKKSGPPAKIERVKVKDLEEGKFVPDPAGASGGSALDPDSRADWGRPLFEDSTPKSFLPATEGYWTNGKALVTPDGFTQDLKDGILGVIAKVQGEHSHLRKFAKEKHRRFDEKELAYNKEQIEILKQNSKMDLDSNLKGAKESPAMQAFNTIKGQLAQDVAQAPEIQYVGYRRAGDTVQCVFKTEEGGTEVVDAQYLTYFREHFPEAVYKQAKPLGMIGVYDQGKPVGAIMPMKGAEKLAQEPEIAAAQPAKTSGAGRSEKVAPVTRAEIENAVEQHIDTSYGHLAGGQAETGKVYSATDYAGAGGKKKLAQEKPEYVRGGADMAGTFTNKAPATAMDTDLGSRGYIDFHGEGLAHGVVTDGRVLVHDQAVAEKVYRNRISKLDPERKKLAERAFAMYDKGQRKPSVLKQGDTANFPSWEMVIPKKVSDKPIKVEGYVATGGKHAPYQAVMRTEDGMDIAVDPKYIAFAQHHFPGGTWHNSGGPLAPIALKVGDEIKFVVMPMKFTQSPDPIFETAKARTFLPSWLRNLMKADEVR